MRTLTLNSFPSMQNAVNYEHRVSPVLSTTAVNKCTQLDGGKNTISGQ